MAAPSSSAQTVDRALEVLDVVARVGACRLADLAERTGLDRRIVGRLVGSLTGADLLRATSDGRYDLGTRLVELGALAEQRNDLAVSAQPIVDQLAKLTQATTIVHRLRGRELVPVLVTTPTDVFAVGYPQGRRIALHEGIGRAVLAWLPPDEITAVLDDASLPGECESWSAQLEQVRRDDVVVSFGEIIRGITAVGSAVRQRDGRPVAAVVVVAPEGAHPENFRDEVVSAAARIARVIGGNHA